MSAHLSRAQLLLSQSRPAEAERELMIALAHEPQQPLLHAFLALSRADQRRPQEAVASAQTAVGLAPDVAFCHYVHALILHRNDDDKAALAAIQAALRLDPEGEELLTLQGSIQLSLRDWPATLASAEQALALNSEHVPAVNLRAMALVRLGRKEEASQTVSYALHRAPEDALSHANQGWTCLHRNDPRAAQEHFREALRLEPDMEYARHGMLEALKARNPVYRGMLAYYLWIGRQTGRTQWAFFIGSYFVMRFALGAAATQPWIWGVVILFYLFIYLSWTASPLFNLLLRIDRFGRLVLSRDERLGSTCFGALLLPAVGCLTWAYFAHSGIGLVVGLMLLVLSICVAVVFNRHGRARKIMAAALVVMGLLVANVIRTALGDNDVDFTTALTWFSYGFIAFQLGANLVSRK